MGQLNGRNPIGGSLHVCLAGIQLADSIACIWWISYALLIFFFWMNPSAWKCSGHVLFKSWLIMGTHHSGNFNCILNLTFGFTKLKCFVFTNVFVWNFQESCSCKGWHFQAPLHIMFSWCHSCRCCLALLALSFQCSKHSNISLCLSFQFF